MILLVDMDAFFASVEQAHHPQLRGKPVIVCGDPSRRGVVTAASYEARPSGVRAGMPLQEARRLCPDAIYVEGDPEKYVALSLQLLNLYLSITPDVEPFSVDEAFLSVGKPGTTLDDASVIARDLQRTIDARFGLGASIGIGPNKLIAKMAAGVRKPRGLTALDEAGFRAEFWSQEVQALWGVGEKMSARLREIGIMTVGDLGRAPAGPLKAEFGIIGPQLKEAAWGKDDTPLVPYHEGVEAKSMGHEVTLAEDSDDPAMLEGMLLRLSDQVARRLRSEGYVGRTVCVKLRDRRFVTRLRQRVLEGFTAEHRPIFETARALMREHWRGDALRLVGVTVSQLERAPEHDQSELFAHDLKAVRLRTALDRVRDRLGEASLIPAATMTRRRRLKHVPFGPVGGRPGGRARREA
ncbi:MAG: DNA polymerase IV [Candidatus Eisenbacteria bacterium]|uniref:DNA polymerase IV n=1 Tax=Eiseniibacteriota bacterium TaxID=2212470 RepID=A0A9D6LCJ2_UNCEI|nr:DNA polymerase IV [Candidatus Eisenbacteria bacterium]MBI3540209.1 DNA polymerase IV [Candidatus Eisenbacteria bacterium]